MFDNMNEIYIFRTFRVSKEKIASGATGGCFISLDEDEVS